MEQRVHFVTVATADLDAARRFYVDGLRWTPTLDVPDEIIFFQIGPGLMFGLFDTAAFAADVGGAAPPTLGGFALAHNVPGAEHVDRVIEAAAAAGATVVKPPQQAAFGGYHGYFSDPNGVLWEIAYNPGWRVADDGRVSLG